MQKYQNIQLLCSCNYKIVTKNSKQVRKCVQFFYIPCLFYLFPQQNFKVMCEIHRDERGMNVEMQIHDLPGQRAHCVNPLNPWNSFDVRSIKASFVSKLKQNIVLYVYYMKQNYTRGCSCKPQRIYFIVVKSAIFFSASAKYLIYVYSRRTSKQNNSKKGFQHGGQPPI